MTPSRSAWRLYWPWLLILLPLALGPALGACSKSSTPATATPTKTARPAAVQPQATPSVDAGAPIETDDASPLPPTTDPVPSPVAKATRAPAAQPTAAPAPGAPAGELMASPDFGAQAFLWWREEVADRDVQLMHDAGFRWVKQYFSWQDVEGAGRGQFDWTHTDRIVDQVQKAGLRLLVRISANPDRPFWGGNPPDSTKDFAAYAGALAARYKGRIQAYQVWNEPNLAREWGNKRPDPAGYVGMLKATYTAIKKNDPAAVVITAGMAPTTRDDDVAMPDMKFYQGIYDAMKGNSKGYFDMLGAHGTGWAVGPEADPQMVADTDKLHNNDPSAPELLRVYAFRHIEDIRDLMVRNGDEKKRIVILEFGWTSDDRPNSPYYWHGAGAGIDEPTKGEYLKRAYMYAAEHWQPWIGLMSVIYMPDITWTKEDEQYWWSILGPGYPDLYLRAGYVDLCIYINGLYNRKCKYDPKGSG
jgi:polysaccharide biosynthesis protein PslG